MAEAEEPPKDVTPIKAAATNTPLPEPSSTTSKLIDVGLLVFIVTALSLGTSVFYVMGLSLALHYSIQSYFELKDYIEVTVYWLGPVMAWVVVILIAFGGHLPNVKDILHAKKRRLFHWFMFGLLLLILITLATIYIYFTKDWRRFVDGMFVIVYPCLAWLYGSILIASFAGEKKSRPFVRYSILSGFSAIVFALALGYFWTPARLREEKTSWIYLLNGKTEIIPKPIEARILFSLTQYVIAFRNYNELVVTPVGRIQRIESSREELEIPSSSPTPTPTSTPTPSPPPTPTPTPTPTATPTATPSPSPAPSATITPSQTANSVTRHKRRKHSP